MISERNHKNSFVFKGRPFPTEIKVRVINLTGINGLGKPYGSSKLLSLSDICKHTWFLIMLSAELNLNSHELC